MFLPESVEITDVCPRDGFQNIKEWIPTETKIKIIKALIDAGIKTVEVTSFVSSKWIPQMADAGEVVEAIRSYAAEREVQTIALVPNRRGFDNAVQSGVDTVSFVVSVSEAHNRNNVNKTPLESIAQFREIAVDKPKALRLRLAVATSFGCPFGTVITKKMVGDIVKRGLDAGADEIILADTIGSANPRQVEETVNSVLELTGSVPVGLHFHNTRGLALANMMQAVDCGITRFESAAGGLGGCPYAPGASGNTATEDVVGMFEAMGISTGIHTEGLNKVLDIIKNEISVPMASHYSTIRYGKCSESA